jgi:HlyD family type I secretion membrane fusion protein
VTANVAHEPFVIGTTRTIGVGVLLVIFGFSGFLMWAATAPLTSAAVAPAVVVADSRNKGIQHLEGGIIREVFVRAGDRVSAGQVLARLDSAKADADLGRLRAAMSAGLAERARLIAERDGLDRIKFAKELLEAKDDPDVGEAMMGQQSLFNTHKAAEESERNIINQRIAQYEEEIKGIRAQVASEDRQLALIHEELKDVRAMVAQGLERKARLLALERAAASLDGQRGQHLADVARVHQNIAEMQERLVNLKTQHVDKAGTDLRDVETKLVDFNKQIVAAADTSKRLDITAPVSGKVVAVFRETPGGVVKPGETILELLPDQDQLVIEAQVRPQDIDGVVVGAPASVRLTAYNRRRTPSLSGQVETVSPDRIVDREGKSAFFLARVVVNIDTFAESEGLKLYPGMSAVVFIETGRETMLDYFLTPLFYGIERGMREQ